MKIIQTAAAPNPRRVRIFLAEKAITVAFEERDMMAEAFKTAEFTEMNPWQRVPLLVFDDGRTLAESVAICRYFEEMQPDPPLFGAGAFGKAAVEMWNRRVELGLFAAIAHAFRHLHPKMAHLEMPQVPAWGEVNKEKVQTELMRLDQALAKSRYLAGDAFSIADITLLVAIDFMKPSKLSVPDCCMNIARWYAEVSARPSAKA
jgi:glutathione S-transferase